MVDPIGTRKSELPAPGTSSLGAGGKEEKAVKETRKMFKQIGKVASKIKGIPGAIGAIGSGIESVMPFLETLAPLFQAFEPILMITNAMFAAFAGAVTAELLPALQPFFIALIGMIPIFSELGTTVGQLMLVGLIPLINLFVPLLNAFIPLIAIFLNFIGFEGILIGVVAVVVILGIAFFALISPLLPLIIVVTAITLVIIFLVAIIRDNWVPIMEFFSNIMNAIGAIIFNIVLPAIGAFIMGLAIMIDAITFGMAGAVNYVNSLMGTLPGATEPPPPIYPTSKIAEIEGLQMGTDLITREGLFYGHAGESVRSSIETGLQTALLEEIRDLQREQLLEIKWRMR